MLLVKKCRHGRGKRGKARQRAWSACGCTWYADVHLDGQRHYVPLGPDRREAEARAAELGADRARGRLEPQARRAGRLTDLVDGYLAEREPDLRPNTLAKYRTAASHVRSWWGGTPVSQVTTERLRDFRADLRETFGAGWADSIYRLVTHALDSAADRGIIEPVVLPAEPRRMRTVRRVSPRMTVAEARRVVDALPEPYDSMAELALLTGLRRGELLGLRRRDVAPGGARLQVGQQVTATGLGPPKTGTSERTLGLSPRAAELVAARLAQAPGPNDRLWPRSAYGAAKTMQRALAGLGWGGRGWGWHSLRHANTALRNAARQPLRDAAAELGHGAHMAQTMAYGWAAETDATALDHALEQALAR